MPFYSEDSSLHFENLGSDHERLQDIQTKTAGQKSTI